MTGTFPLISISLSHTVLLMLGRKPPHLLHFGFLELRFGQQPGVVSRLRTVPLQAVEIVTSDARTSFFCLVRSGPEDEKMMKDKCAEIRKRDHPAKAFLFYRVLARSAKFIL